MQWADAALLDFVEYLLEWSRSHPLFVVTLARPELIERRPTWGAGQRNFTSLYLEPLSPQAMEELLAGLVPGLPGRGARRRSWRAPKASRSTRSRPCECCSTAACSCRTGRATGRPGEIETLEVPETLHALIAARLDGLTAEERRLLQDAAVLGKTFTQAGARRPLRAPEAELEPVLVALVRKEVLGVQADPRSPEHGQYGFLQDLVRHVAYETLVEEASASARHLAAAAHLRAAFAEDEDEVVEVIASHYLAAYEAAPDADDAGEIRGKARPTLVRAGERAESLAAAAEASATSSRRPTSRTSRSIAAVLLHRAGDMASRAANLESARHLLGGRSPCTRSSATRTPLPA